MNTVYWTWETNSMKTWYYVSCALLKIEKETLQSNCWQSIVRDCCEKHKEPIQLRNHHWLCCFTYESDQRLWTKVLGYLVEKHANKYSHWPKVPALIQCLTWSSFYFTFTFPSTTSLNCAIRTLQFNGAIFESNILVRSLSICVWETSIM